MKIKELRQKTERELSNLLIENQYRLGRLKFDLVSKKLKNVKEVKGLRRDVARIKTILKRDSKKD